MQWGTTKQPWPPVGQRIRNNWSKTETLFRIDMLQPFSRVFCSSLMVYKKAGPKREGLKGGEKGDVLEQAEELCEEQTMPLLSTTIQASVCTAKAVLAGEE